MCVVMLAYNIDSAMRYAQVREHRSKKDYAEFMDKIITDNYAHAAELLNASLFAGVAVYNTVRHQENVLSDEYKIPTRFTSQAGGRWDVSTNQSIYFSVMHMMQSKANEITVGSAYGILLDEDGKEIDFGMWYRYKDAVIPYIGFQTNGFQVGFTYDYTVSALKTGSRVRNGYELTLLYNARDNRELKRLIPWY